MRTGLAAVNSKHPQKPPIGTRAIEREAIMIGRCALRFAVTGKIILQNSWTNKFDPRQIETLWREDRRIRQSKKNTGRFS